jgi:hypothetical protein
MSAHPARGDRPLGFEAFAGQWRGQIASGSVELDIRADGFFRWLGVMGEARGEGDGRMTRAADAVLIPLAFLQAAPLRASLGGAGESLLLTGLDGHVVALFRSP